MAVRCCHRLEIVGEKSDATYRRILGKYDLDPQGFLMVGNSLRSDILPVIQLGGHAVHIPHADTWLHEKVEPAGEYSDGYTVIENIAMLPDYISSLER